MMPLICPGCGGRMDIEADKKLVPFSCPYCSLSLVPEKNGQAVVLKPQAASTKELRPAVVPVTPASADPVPLLQKAQMESDPVKRYTLLKEAEKAAPEDLRVIKALLMHGRLHERSKHKVDFSVIKCYLLHMYEIPKEHTNAQREQMVNELFKEELLKKAMSLASDPIAFLTEYLTMLSMEYIRLFLQGSNRYMKSVFGFSSLGKAQKLLAEPAAAMITRMLEDAFLSSQQREWLARAFYAGFSKEFQGETQFLDEALGAVTARVKD